MLLTIEHFLKNSTVLVVDDSPDNLMIATELLRKSYRIKVANNGEKALKIAQSQTPPDLILLDVMMPNMNGYEVCRQLKRDSKTAQIPVIFLTTKSDIDDEAHALGLGAADFITKPVNAPILMARVKTHITMKIMQDFLLNQNRELKAELLDFGGDDLPTEKI